MSRDTKGSDTDDSIAPLRSSSGNGPTSGVTRREFLQTGAAVAGLGLGLGGSLGGCDSDDDGGGGDETRTYLFDFSRVDTSHHDMVMVAGKKRAKLLEIGSGDLDRFRGEHPILTLLPNERVTHWIEIEMPSQGIQLCYVQRVSRLVTDGSWDMAMQFYHFPRSALHAAKAREIAQLSADGLMPSNVKWGRHGASGEQVASFTDPVGEDMFKDATTTATTMVAGHPEIACGEQNSAAYIQNCIVGTQPLTQELGEVIDDLGPAQPPANWGGCGSTVTQNATGWGTLYPVCNPDTNQQAVNSKTGALQYVPVWAEATKSAARDAITQALTTVKGDTSLGVNVTITPDSYSGKIWTRQDGTSTVEQQPDPTAPGTAVNLGYTTRDKSPGHGYSVTVTDVSQDTGNSNVDALVTLKFKNWFVRYLAIYIRLLDDNGKPILVSQWVQELGTDTVSKYFPLYDCCSSVNGDDAMILHILDPEGQVLGMPISSSNRTFTIPVPNSATSILVLAGGMGNQSGKSNPFYDTTIPGATLTGVFDLAMPPLFLGLNAAAGIAAATESLEDTAILIVILPLVLDLYAAIFDEIAFDNPSGFENLGVRVGSTLLSKGAGPFTRWLVSKLAEGETEEDLLDAIPMIGGFFAAVACIGTVAQMAETASEVAQSPPTYQFVINLTHEIQVTIHHDPNDPAGFPATATHYTVIAEFDDKGTPTKITQDLPATQTTTSQVVKFEGVPLGGTVTINVGFYSDNDWLAGQGSVGPVPNTAGSTQGAPLALSITITENKVPLQPTTVYSHKEVIALDDGGNHVWFATTTPPPETEPSGCDPQNGQLCELTGITVNTTGAGVGYTWQSFNSAVTNCVDGAVEQLHQFANLSTTQTPQNGYLYSGCGFGETVRVVYDLLGKTDFNFYNDTATTGAGFNSVIRQIRLGSTPSYDSPSSNKAWGKLQFPSDALLLHPAGQIISVNSTFAKVEVLALPPAAVPDDQAALSNAYGGNGLRPGLMDGPTLAALAPDGTLLVLESRSNRIQAFDLNANPVPRFQSEYFFPLKKQAVTEYLSFGVEYKGYMYVLSTAGDPGSQRFTMDIYTPHGVWLSSTTGVVAAKLAVNYWRDIYTENFQVLTLPDGSWPARTEPSISHWIPSTP